MTAGSGVTPDARRPIQVTVDVVSLARMRRLASERHAVVDRMLLHPLERAGASGAERARRLGAALGTKECWIKAHADRPPGWTFDRAAFVPCARSSAPAAVQALIAEFASSLDATDIEAGVVIGDVDDDAGDRAASLASRGSWAWHGLFDEWLISAVVG